MDEDLFRRRQLSMVDLLADRAAAIPNNQAFVYIPERDGSRASLTFSALERRACVVAARLMRQTTPGDRAILLFPSGLDFVVAFFGCLTAGVIAVPVMVPRRTAGRDSGAAIMTDCAPRVVLTSTDLLDGRPDLMEKFAATDFSWIVLSAADDAQSPSGLDARAPCLDDVALLQYTSGSTSTPKGVMITHGNIIANLEMIRLRMNNPARATSVGWVPLYHDMGLMMGVMQPLYLGGLSVLLAPAAFMRRPLNWLRTIHEHRATITSSPNFAFDLCVSRFQPESMRGIDLTCWQLALNGAEPVRADTIERFTRTFAPFGFDAGTMYPGYGLAEATLLVSGGQRRSGPVRRRVSRDALRTGRITRPRDDADAQCVVSSGQCVPRSRIAVVAPESGRRVPALSVGEVWVSGPHIARGYWHNQDATEATFEGRIAGESGVDWLRTGDLGFQDQDGELYLTGRIKDLIIIRGMNHYPQDIEMTVQDSHPALRRDGGAAFSVPDETGAERLVIVQEVERTQRTNLDIDVMAGTIREAVTIAHEISTFAITLIPPASLPKTTSGKVQRSLTRQLWLERGLDVLGTA